MPYLKDLGPETLHLNNFYEVCDHLVNPFVLQNQTRQSSIRIQLTQGMLYPRRYLSELSIVKRILESGGTTLMAPEYRNRLLSLAAGDVAVRHMLVVHNPESPAFDPRYLRILQSGWKPLQDAKKPVEVHLAWYEAVREQLDKTFGTNSSVNNLYKQGADDPTGTQGPKSNYWSVALIKSPGEGVSSSELHTQRRVTAIAFSNYNGADLAGYDVYFNDAAFEGTGLKGYDNLPVSSSRERFMPTALAEFEDFWNRVFVDEERSTDLRRLTFSNAN